MKRFKTTCIHRKTIRQYVCNLSLTEVGVDVGVLVGVDVGVFS